MFRSLPLLCSLSLLLALSAGALAQGGLFQWTDDQGRIIYSDRPPADREHRELALPPGPTEQETQAARERAEVLQRMAAERAQERREREERATAARPAPAPPPVPAEPSVEIRYYPWDPYQHRRLRRPWYPWYPGQGPHRPSWVPWDPPPEVTQPRRAPEFQWPRPRAPEFAQ